MELYRTQILQIFENVSTMQNSAAGADEAEVDMVFVSASAAKGILTLKNESVYTKGNLQVSKVSAEHILYWIPKLLQLPKQVGNHLIS